jgi:transcriptional regulator with XRE-family HTH domain
MTTQTVGPPSSAAVARELRAELARLDINGSELARRIGKPQQTVNRWLKTGRGLDLESLGLIGSETGISVLDLLRAAQFRCTQPSSDPAFPAQLRRHGAARERYTGPLRRASDCVA